MGDMRIQHGEDGDEDGEDQDGEHMDEADDQELDIEGGGQ